MSASMEIAAEQLRNKAQLVVNRVIDTSDSGEVGEVGRMAAIRLLVEIGHDADRLRAKLQEEARS